VILSIIRPHAMNRIPAARLTIDEATRIGSVRWIILDDFPMQHGEKDWVCPTFYTGSFALGCAAPDANHDSRTPYCNAHPAF
jgi:hypothetical protein